MTSPLTLWKRCGNCGGSGVVIYDFGDSAWCLFTIFLYSERLCTQCEGKGKIPMTFKFKEGKVRQERIVNFKGSPEGPGLYNGYDVLLDGKVIGFIEIGGHFKVNRQWLECPDEPLNVDERLVINRMCERVSQMPSEYGWLGVGEVQPSTRKPLVHVK
jgi:hypothetical protein